jgi:Bacterial lipid A biosynthesis acyltransferase
MDVASGVVSYMAYYGLRLLPFYTFRAAQVREHRKCRSRRRNEPHVRQHWSRVHRILHPRPFMGGGSGHEHLAVCRERDRPTIVFGVHLSNWEVVGAALLGLGYGVCTLYKPTRNRFQDRIANAVRLRGGAELVPPGPRGARRAYRALTDRRCVFLTWVDEAIDGSIRAPAFGRPMHRRGNLAAMVRLARSTGSRSPPLSSANGAHVSTLRSDRPSNSSRQRMRTPRCSPTCSD